jgi:hypothetical protein
MGPGGGASDHKGNTASPENDLPPLNDGPLASTSVATLTPTSSKISPAIDIRYVVTSLQGSYAEHIYETIYCARGRAENLIKQHKAQLSSDRTSCRSPLANQMRLILHTGAYWLLLDLRAAIPSWNPLRQTEFATIRLRLLKIASTL